MKKLLIIRHAKATDEGPDGDFARPLKKSGKDDAQRLAVTLKDNDLIPQIIYTSPALRAKTTADIIGKLNDISLGNPIDSVYEASDSTLLSVINNFPDEFDFIALTGHNPGLSIISTYLSLEYHSLPTCGAVLIIFEFDDWALISAATGKVEWVYEP